MSLRPVIIVESPIVHITHQPQLYSCNTRSITERPPVSAWQLVSRGSGEDSTRVEMGESDRHISAKDCQNLHCSSISGSKRSQSASKLLLDCVLAHLKYFDLRIIDRTPEKVPTSLECSALRIWCLVAVDVWVRDVIYSLKIARTGACILRASSNSLPVQVGCDSVAQLIGRLASILCQSGT